LLSIGSHMARVFISYRRSDSISIAGRIYDRLAVALGKNNVFKDVDDIPVGLDFRQAIQDEVSSCDLVLVIIGPTWHSVEDAFGERRLESPDDFVRLEVETALEQADVKVIPLLVSGAKMPSPTALPESLQPLVYINSATVREDPDFNRDIERLVRVIHEYRRQVKASSTQTKPLVTLRSWHISLTLMIFGVYLLLGLMANRTINPLQLEVGEVAPHDIFANRTVTYTSEVLTESERAGAAAAVEPI